MENIFITDLFDDWGQLQPSRKVRFLNKILEKLGFWVRLSAPPSTGVMTNIEQRMNMYHLASQVLFYKVPGDFVELGCHTGKSAALLQKVIDAHDGGRALHLYDSFEGLPEVHAKDGDTGFQAGQFGSAAGSPTVKDDLLANFSRLGLQAPVIHAGWFEDTLPTGMPEKIAFAHLDGDLYDSIMVSLEYTYPRLSTGAVCLIDDYCDPGVHDCWNELPGVKQACDEFLHDKTEKVSLLYAGGYSHGFFRKL